MLKLLGTRTQFAVLAIAGFSIFLVGPLVLHSTSCPTAQAPQNGPIQGGSHTDSKNDSANQTGNVAIGKTEQQHPTQSDQTAPDRSHYDWVLSWFCADLKITDLALVYFTYCLVVVGWYAMRSNERTLHDIEAAWLVGGPGPTVVELDKTIKVYIAVHNQGRTVGILKEVFVQFSQEEPRGKPRYDLRKGKSVLFESGVAPEKDLVPPAGPFTSVVSGPQYLAGYVIYTDIFRRRHVNRFCVRLDAARNYMEPAGPPAWNEWD